MICPYNHPAEITCAFCAPATEPLVDFSDYIEQLDIAGQSLARVATLRSPDCEHEVGERCKSCGTYPILDLETYSRAPLQPGVVIDENPQPAHPVMAIVARWAAGIALVGAGAAVMYAEGQRQAMPGIGFAVGLSMLVGAVLLTVGRGRC